MNITQEQIKIVLRIRYSIIKERYKNNSSNKDLLNEIENTIFDFAILVKATINPDLIILDFVNECKQSTNEL